LAGARRQRLCRAEAELSRRAARLRAAFYRDVVNGYFHNMVSDIMTASITSSRPASPIPIG